MSAAIRHIDVTAADAAVRLDRFLKRRFPTLTQGHLQKLLRTGQLRVDGRRAEASTRLVAGQSIRVPPLDPLPSDAARPARLSHAETRAIREMVIHDDGKVVALAKPAGLAVQGGSKTTKHVDRLLPALDVDGERCRLVHRLDRDTAGLLLLGRGAATAAYLTESFRRGDVRKLYWAVVRGRVPEEQGLIDLPLAKVGGPGRERMAGDGDGRPARTLFRVVARAGRVATWLAMRPVTGRTHQLRAHSAAIGHPIFGDHKYGTPAERPSGQPEGLMLLARSAQLPHPDGRTLDLSVPMPDHLRRAFDWLGFTPDMALDHGHEVFDA